MGQLYREIGPERLAAAQAIRIFAPAYIMPAVVKTEPPTSPNNARFHVNYCAALAATGVNVILPEHSADFATHFSPHVAELMGRITVLCDDNFVHYSESRIEVLEADGNVIVVAGNAPRGSPDNPLGEEGVKAKFVNLIGDRMGAAACKEWFARVMAIEDEAGTRFLLDPFC